MLEITTLGKIEIRLNGAEVEHRLESRRTQLIVFLAVSSGPQPRALVARLFWPEADDVLARTNLRSLLKRLNQDGYRPYLETDRESIRLGPNAAIHCDVLTLRPLIERLEEANMAQLEQAFARYTGAFLGDLSIDKLPQYSEWVDSIRLELEAKMIQLCFRLARLYLAAERYADALAVTTRLIELAPDDHDAMLVYLHTLVALGHLGRGRREFSAYVQTMREDLPGWEPTPELAAFGRQLMNSSQAARLTQAGAAAWQDSIMQPKQPIERQEDSRPTAHADDHIPCGFVGRRQEAANLENLLSQNVRLIAVVGMGGIGKTAFVRSRLPALRRRFEDRVYFTNLQPCHVDVEGCVQTLLNAVGEALGLQLETHTPTFEQIQAALATAPSCLVLDHFETLQAGVQELGRLVETTPSLTVIVTSRRTLQLKECTQLRLDGLALASQDGEVEQPSDAAELFLQRVRRVYPRIRIEEIDPVLLDRLCEQVGGHPLALELAALQLDFYQLEEIVASVEQNVASLASHEVDRAEDHQSLQALLAGMWTILSPDARQTIAALSLFANTFDHDAMLAVAPAPLAIYRELRDASLLQPSKRPGSVSLHPLVRQYARSQLSDPAVGARHAHYILGLLDLEERPLVPERVTQPEQFRRLQQYERDIVSAWEWAVKNEAWELLTRTIVGLGHFLYAANFHRRATTLLESLIAVLAPDLLEPGHKRLAGLAALVLAWLQYNHVDANIGAAWCQKSVAWLEEEGTTYEQAAAYAHCAKAEIVLRQQITQQEQWLRRTLALCREHGYLAPRFDANVALLYQYLYQGRWPEFEAFDREHARLLPEVSWLGERKWFMPCYAALTLRHWDVAERRIDQYEAATASRSSYKSHLGYIAEFSGHLLAQQDNLSAAIDVLQPVLPVAQEYQPHTAALASAYLALWQAGAGHDSASRQTIAQALALTRRPSSNRFFNGIALKTIGAAFLLLGDGASAEHYLAQALEIGLSISDTTTIFTSLFHLSTLWADELPQTLMGEIRQRALVSPAMHFAHLPLIRARNDAPEIQTPPVQATTFWATDLSVVRSLTRAVAQHTPKLRLPVDPSHS